MGTRSRLQVRLPNASLNTKLTITYTVIIVVVASVLSIILFYQLRDAQRAVTRERLLELVSLSVTQIDGDYHTLIVAPKDGDSSFYRIIQTELRNIQETSTAISRITTLRQQDDGQIVVVVDQPLGAAAGLPIGHASAVNTPLLAGGLVSISEPVVEAQPVTLPAGGVRFYGYAPITDQYGRQDGVLAIELDGAPLLASEAQARNSALLALGFCLPLVLLGGSWLVRATTAPVGELLHGAERIIRGEVSHRVRVHSSDELGRLAATFNTMTDTLQGRISAELQARQKLDQSHQQLQAYSRSLEQAIEQQRQLSETVRRMSLPVLPIADQIIVLPLIGTIDDERARDLAAAILAGIGTYRASVILLDLTGVPLVDDVVAQVLVQAINAARLLGARTLLVGISPELAQTFVHIGADLHHTMVSATLQSGLLQALALTERRLVAK